MGEYSALHAAGVFDADTLIRITAFRGREMAKAAEGVDTLMCAVIGLDAAKLEEVVKEAASDGIVEISNYNAKGQIVIAGEHKAVRKAEELAKEAGARRCMELRVSSAFHTSFMKPAGDAIEIYFSKVPFGEMQIPVLFNATAKPLQEGETIKELLVRQVQSSVRMEEMIYYLKDQGVDTVVEIGPGNVLSGFIRRTVDGITTYSINDAEDLYKVLEALKGE